MQQGSDPRIIDFESSVPWSKQRPDTLVIHCSDHRYQRQFDELVEKHLGCTEFDRLVVPGGPHFLMAASALPKFEWAGRRWLKYLVKNHQIRTLILIAHDDCGWYKDISVGPFTIPLLRERQLADLRKMPHAISENLPDVAVHLYFARPNEAGVVEFVEVI